ncbi:MAG: hypothetical protein ACPGWS_09805, partial [Solirubrobacterales bacterium]
MAQNERRTLEIVTKVRDQATRTMSRITRVMVGGARRIIRAFSAFTGLGAALAGFFAGRALIQRFVDGARALDSLGKAAENLGSSAEAFGAFQFAAERSGATVQGATNAYRNLLKVVGQAKLGLGEATRAFNTLGVSVS